MSKSPKKEIFSVKGMTCVACEARVEKQLKKIKGIQNVKASFSKNNVEVQYESVAIPFQEMAKTLKEEDYTLVQKTVNPSVKVAPSQVAQTTVQSEATWTLSQFSAIVVILLVGYLLIKNTIGFNFIPEVTTASGYGVLFVIGLLTSLHCVAMCGGINVAQCVAYAKPGSKPSASVIPSILYNGGRVISYTIIGGIAGAIGSAVSFTGWARGLIAIVAGIFMLLMSISMMGILPSLNKFIPRMPRFLRIKAIKSTRNKGPLYVGLVNGLMPCGPLQAMQLYALGTGSFLVGASSMFFFSLGTVPLMFGLGVVSTMLGKKFTKNMLKVSAVLVLVLGVVMINRGLALSGVKLLPTSMVNSSSNKQAATEETTTDNAQATAAVGKEGVAVIDGDVQTIQTTLTAQGYPEIAVQKGVPVKWHLLADKSSITGCNSTLIIPKYNLEVKLQPGDNLIEFTPDGSGTIPYSCWMGMITSQINVVDALE